MAVSASSLIESVDDLAVHEVVRLLITSAGTSRSWLVGNPEVDGRVVDRFWANVARRRAGEPLQYIEESVQFGPIELHVDSRVLIPRPETERLWELAVSDLARRPDPTVLDLCTGSGNLALALKYAVPSAMVIGVDVSPEALNVAVENATRLGLDVDFRQGDLFYALSSDPARSFDFIVSNPPYIATGEYAELPREVAGFEPMAALLAGSEGLDVLTRIATDAIAWMSPGATLICEIGEGQGDACRRLFAAYGPEIEKDLTGRDRFVLGYAPMLDNVH